MSIKNHRWDTAHYQASPNKSGKIDPIFIVQHYTAGYTASSAIDILTRKGSNVSAHVVIDLDGTITQLVPFNVRAWHAGPSSHMGYSGLNGYSIGIEIVNIGYLRKLGRDNYQDAYGNVKPWLDEDVIAAKNARVGSGTFYWPRYTAPQIEATYELSAALVKKYGIIDIVSHEEIDTRGWKTDPGPAFPMKKFKMLVDDRSANTVYYEVTASSLNVRMGPGSSYKVSDQLAKGHRVEVFDIRGDWARINDDEWVHAGYLRRV